MAADDAQLTILGASNGTEAKFRGDRPVRVGSSQNADIVVNGIGEKTLALFVRLMERWFVVDANGDSNLAINGGRIFQSPITDGDEITVGGANLRVRLAKPTPIRSMDDPEVQRTQQKYPGLAKLGITLKSIVHKGSTGIQFRAAWARRPETPIMLKMLASHLTTDEDAMFRFCRGVTAAGDLRHPHLLRLFRAGKTGDGWYLIAEFAPGGSLRDCCSSKNMPGESTRAELAKKVGLHISQAIEGIVAAELVHRAITPSAILFDEQGNAKLGDFTLARGEVLATLRRFTMAGNSVGSQPFMSPEQALGSPNLDTRADIYSLGACMYFAATGRPPIEGKSMVELVDNICRRKPTPPRQLNPHLDVKLEPVILKCLAKDPRDRFQSPQEIHAAIENGNHDRA